jgi:hypothetical protein
MRFVLIRALVGSRSALVAPLAAAAAGVLLALCVAVAPAWASSDCPNEAFRSGSSANLPDCRAYELVSPAEKNGGGVDGGFVVAVEAAPGQAAADGDAVTFASLTAFTETGPLSAELNSQYLSVRGADGWSTQSIEPPQVYPGGQLDQNGGALDWSLYQGFSEDLSHAFLVSEEPPLVAGAPLDYYNPYVRNNSDGSYALLSSVTPPVQHGGVTDSELGGFESHLAGFSADSSHVIFSANDALTPGAVPGHENLYEWAGGGLELVSVLPGSGEAVAGAHFGSPLGHENSNYSHAISSDGSRVFWTGPESHESQLYMHEVGVGGARTVEVSASQKSGGGGPSAPAVYWTASADGSLVYFTSCAQLTNDSTAVFHEARTPEDFFERCGWASKGSELGGSDLYQYDASTGKLTDITVDPNVGETANVEGVLGASEDGSYVYFAARGNLTGGALPAPPADLPESAAEAVKLYRWHEGTITFIAYSGRLNGSIGEGQGYEENKYELYSAVHEARVSPDGMYVTFDSFLPLTGYDNVKPQGDCTGQLVAREKGAITSRCLEVYEYSAAANRLVCVSCSPLGLPPTGPSKVPSPVNVEFEQQGGWQSTTDQQRYLVDGGRLFFDSEDALLPQATNGLENVYEYEPASEGSCATTGGCVYLISTGTGAGKSQFLDASASGEDVFFTTYDQLVPQDGDEAADLYDARVDGGFSEPAVPVCSGEACKPAVTPAPAIYQAPPSATFTGDGNPPFPPAPVVKTKTAKRKATKHKKKKQQKGRRAEVGAKRAARASVERKGGR